MTIDWWGDFLEGMLNRFVPPGSQDDAPEPVPDTPVFPPDGDSPEPTWQDAQHYQDKLAKLTPEQYQEMVMGNFNRGAMSDDLRAYHSHLCPCPDCAEAEARRQSRIHSMLRKNSQW